MNKLTAIRIKYDDGTYSDEIPVSTLAEYIFWDDSHNLVDILGNIDMSKGTVQAQLNEKIDDNELDQYLSDEISTDVGDWLDTHISPSGNNTIIYDTGLNTPHAAAESKATGDTLKTIVKVSNTQPTSEFNRIWIKNNEAEIEIPTKEELDDIAEQIGDLTELETTEKSNLVGAINEVLGDVPQVDNTLSVTGAAADAKKTGDELTELNERLNVNNIILKNALYDTETTFNQSDITDDYGVSPSNGTLWADTSNKYSASGYVPICGIKKVGISNGVGQFAYYDVNKTFISGEAVPSVAHQYAEYNVPANAAYARFTLYKSLKTTVTYKFPSATNDAPKGAVRYDYDMSLSEAQKRAGRANIDAASKDYAECALAFQINKKNKANTGTLTSGKYVNAGTGELLDGSYTASDYQKVVPELKVGISRGIGQFAFYDINKNYISGVAVASTIHDYTEYDVPQNAYFARFTFSNSFTQSELFYTVTNGEECPLYPFVVAGTEDLKVPDFKRLRDAVEFAKKWSNTCVFVQAGEYNLITEFATEIASSPTTQFGIGLSNGVHIIGESGSVVKCNYEGTDLHIVDNLSPFYTEQKDGGFTLENVTIQEKNCRYCVHDEYSSTDHKVINKYINCDMYVDFTNPPTGRENYYHQCIGGGVALHSYVFIEGCKFKTKAAEGTSKLAVSYHNSYYAGAQSRIIVSNSYFADKATIRFTHYGLSTVLSEGIVQNCSLGAAPILRPEDPSQTTPENFTLLAFNNEIR